MDFAPLQSFASYIDAHILMGRLEEEGIRCWLKDENTVTIDPILTNAVGGIKLMVAANQLERAQALLESFIAEKQSRLTCPHCGSNNIELVSSSRKAGNWLAAIATWLVGSYAVAPVRRWHCFYCGEEFKAPAESGDTPLTEGMPS